MLLVEVGTWYMAASGLPGKVVEQLISTETCYPFLVRYFNEETDVVTRTGKIWADLCSSPYDLLRPLTDEEVMLVEMGIFPCSQD